MHSSMVYTVLTRSILQLSDALSAAGPWKVATCDADNIN